MENFIEYSPEELAQEVWDESGGLSWEGYVKECLETEVAAFWYKAARIFFPEKSLPAPSVEWIGKVSDAGRASFSDWKNLTGYSVKLNWDLAVASQENFVEFRDQVIPHEICHIVAVLFFGLPAEQQSNGKTEYHFHGIDWQLTMRKMGKNPERTHDMDTTGISQRLDRPFVYKCPACSKEFHLTIILHNKILKGQRRNCGTCGSKLPVVFVRDETQKPVIGAWLQKIQK